MITALAKESKQFIFPKYSSLSQTDDVWISDFSRVFNIIKKKLVEFLNSSN